MSAFIQRRWHFLHHWHCRDKRPKGQPQRGFTRLEKLRQFFFQRTPAFVYRSFLLENGLNVPLMLKFLSFFFSAVHHQFGLAMAFHQSRQFRSSFVTMPPEHNSPCASFAMNGFPGGKSIQHSMDCPFIHSIVIVPNGHGDELLGLEAAFKKENSSLYFGIELGSNKNIRKAFGKVHF